jgi:hypothetical protein
MNKAEQTPVTVETPSDRLEGLHRGRVAVFNGVPLAGAMGGRTSEREAARRSTARRADRNVTK